MVIKFNTTDYLSYKRIYGLDNFEILIALQQREQKKGMEGTDCNDDNLC